MAFEDFPMQQQGAQLLQRSVEHGRLSHAYVFSGGQLELLERLAQTLAKTLNCLAPVKRGSATIDCCDRCLSCRKIERGNHPDIHWVRPESKSRVVTTDQIRELMRELQLKPSENARKVAVIVGADRMRVEAANAFLKTLEEPPGGSIVVLLTTDLQKVLETILSRCLRLNFGGEGLGPVESAQVAWLASFSDIAAQEQNSLLGRYRLLDVLSQKLSAIKVSIEEALTARSPGQQYKDVEKSLTEKWEAELAASIEAEYRRQRLDLLALVEWWLRDIWLRTLSSRKAKAQAAGMHPVSGTRANPAQTKPGEMPASIGQVEEVDGLFVFPQMSGACRVAGRISPRQAQENLEILEQLQGRLNTNVQEALALEVGLLKLNL
jgi:DNA polymerase-3 subunit delta'